MFVGRASENATIHGYWARMGARKGDADTARREAEAAARLYRSEGLEEDAAKLEAEVAEALARYHDS